MGHNVFVEFTGYVDETKRPENFPRRVYIRETYSDVPDIGSIQELVNQRFIKLASASGLVILKNPDEPVDNSIVFYDKRWYVPWHMITHMGLRVELLPNTEINLPDSIVPHDPAEEPKKKELVN